MFKHILGFIFGLLLGIIILLFLRKNKYKGPDSNEVKKKVFKYNDKYYFHQCPAPNVLFQSIQLI